MTANKSGMGKELRVWNGRGYCCRRLDDPRWNSRNPPHVNVCAYSRADARRVIAEYCGEMPPDNELRDYFCECWGDAMDGIPRERGLWLEYERGKPERVL